MDYESDNHGFKATVKESKSYYVAWLGWHKAWVEGCLVTWRMNQACEPSIKWVKQGVALGKVKHASTCDVTCGLCKTNGLHKHEGLSILGSGIRLVQP